MPLESADKAMICSAGQASPWFVLMLISSKIFTFGFFLKTLVDLHFMPNDVHEARTWSYGTALWLSLQVYNVDIKYQVKVIRCWAYCRYFIYVIHPISVCILCVALYPYVSMGIVAYLGQLLAINNVWTDWVLINIVGNIRQFLSFVDQWEWGFNLDCILVVLEWGSSSEVDILIDSYWLNHNIQLWCWYFCQWLCVFWQCLTIIFMVFGTILTLHSSTMSYNVNRLLCFLLIILWVLLS
jgi:hypothetical protein